jgi:hypothetical protein
MKENISLRQNYSLRQATAKTGQRLKITPGTKSVSLRAQRHIRIWRRLRAALALHTKTDFGLRRKRTAKTETHTTGLTEEKMNEPDKLAEIDRKLDAILAALAELLAVAPRPNAVVPGTDSSGAARVTDPKSNAKAAQPEGGGMSL